MGNDVILAEQQDEELAALQAIFGEEDCDVDYELRTVKVYVPSKEHVPHIILQAVLVDGYPSQHPPVLQLTAPHLSDDQVASTCTTLEQQFAPGEVVIYSWVEWLKEEGRYLYDLKGRSQTQGDSDAGLAAVLQRHENEGESQDWEPGDEDDEDDEDDHEWHPSEDGLGQEGIHVDTTSGQRRQPRAVSVTSLLDSVRPKIISGEPFTERKSTFQAHIARVHRPEEAFAVVEVLLENNKIRNATHNIMAYRITCEGKGTFHQDCDDDGESAAGGRLLHLLQVSDARDVVVVVSRWFGGVLLGPSRFTLINNTARALLELQGIITGGVAGKATKTSSKGKKK